MVVYGGGCEQKWMEVGVQYKADDDDDLCDYNLYFKLKHSRYNQQTTEHGF